MDAQPADHYIRHMSFAEIWDSLVAVIGQVPQSGLLVVTVAALAGSWIGAIMLRRKVPLGRLISAASTLALGGVLVLVVLQMSRFDPRLDVAVPGLGLPEQIVAGGETRIEMARDGHFWLQAQINGEPATLMVDTGATLTSLSPELAQRAGLEPREGGIPVMLQTANGAISAELTTIDKLTFGNIDASGLDAVIVPGLGSTSLIGMNLLSRLGSWRVEGQTLILVPQASDVVDNTGTAR